MGDLSCGPTKLTLAVDQLTVAAYAAMRGGRCGSLEHYARGWYPALHKGGRRSLPIPVSPLPIMKVLR